MKNIDVENKKIVNIYLEASPNPNTMKFVNNFAFIPQGVTKEYTSREEAESSPLALLLFEEKYVEGVFFMNNFVTVTKSSNIEWFEIQENIKNIIKNYLLSDKSVVNQKDITNTQKQKFTHDTEINTKIKSILDEYVRPAVEQDGGAIQFHSFENGDLKVLLQGSCSGCPSSTITLKSGIENLMKKMVSEVKTVEAING